MIHRDSRCDDSSISCAQPFAQVVAGIPLRGDNHPNGFVLNKDLVHAHLLAGYGETSDCLLAVSVVLRARRLRSAAHDQKTAF
jgi:hypothetical protein